MKYDENNIFAKILRGEIPCKKIYEDEFVLSFHDINPQKKIHALVIPKGKYIDLDDFSNNASPDEMVGLLKGINIVAKKLGISVDTGKGYRALANINEHLLVKNESKCLDMKQIAEETSFAYYECAVVDANIRGGKIISINEELKVLE